MWLDVQAFMAHRHCDTCGIDLCRRCATDKGHEVSWLTVRCHCSPCHHRLQLGTSYVPA